MRLFRLTRTTTDLVLPKRTRTLASKACLKISHRVEAKRSDLPVSVAYMMVHFTRLANARPISLAENLTALWTGKQPGSWRRWYLYTEQIVWPEHDPSAWQRTWRLCEQENNPEVDDGGIYTQNKLSDQSTTHQLGSERDGSVNRKLTMTRVDDGGTYALNKSS